MTERTKEEKVSWGAVIIAVAAAIGGVAECNASRSSAVQAEEYRVEADEALLDRLSTLEEATVKRDQKINAVREELDVHDEEIAELERARVELEIRVGVLSRSRPDGEVDRDALLEELFRLAEEEGVDEFMTSSIPTPDSAEEAAEVLVQEKKAQKKKKTSKPAPPDPLTRFPAAQSTRDVIQQKAY